MPPDEDTTKPSLALWGWGTSAPSSGSVRREVSPSRALREWRAGAMVPGRGEEGLCCHWHRPPLKLRPRLRSQLRVGRRVREVAVQKDQWSGVRGVLQRLWDQAGVCVGWGGPSPERRLRARVRAGDLGQGGSCLGPALWGPARAHQAGRCCVPVRGAALRAGAGGRVSADLAGDPVGSRSGATAVLERSGGAGAREPGSRERRAAG